MASINEIILRSTNPFDNLRSINFWHKQQESEPVVASINQEAIATIEATLTQVIQARHTRTVMLDGDSGSGKTYLLGRLKRTFNDKAFFAYIPPFPQSDYIWRHILRYTVDSLVQVPDGQKNSQLIIWLNGFLSAVKQRSLKEKILKDDILEFLRSDRQKFINKLKENYKINNADRFFGVLHDLANPELYSLACEWLRGDDLSEESLQALRVKASIETEQAAREILANFGKIAADTQPIVLCFDQLESVARLPDGTLDLQSLFNVNTKIHEEDNNFLVIISITTNTWKQNQARIDWSHQARIDEKVSLGLINFEQAEALFSSRLYSLHNQATPRPDFSSYPLTLQHLEESFPGGKTNPGDVLLLGRILLQNYKKSLAEGSVFSFKASKNLENSKSNHSSLLASFHLKWRDEFNKIKKIITRIRYLSSPELIKVLQEALAALQVEDIQNPLFTGTKFASYSLGYPLPGRPGKIGVVWTEDSNMTTFFYVMKACQKSIYKNSSLTLLLIRAEGVGSSKNQGYKLFTQIFTGSSHRRIIPNLTSVHYLATYHSLVKDAREGDLVVENQPLGVKELTTLIRESGIFYDCPLLQDLGIIQKMDETSSGSDRNRHVNGEVNKNNQLLKDDLVKQVKPVKPVKEVKEVKQFLLNLVTTQQIMGRQTLIQNTLNEFPQKSKSEVNQLVEQLCQEKRIQILDPNAIPAEQLICLIP